MSKTTLVFTLTSIQFNNSTVRIITKNDDSIWFVARDFVKAVGRTWHSPSLNAIRKDRKGKLSVYNGHMNLDIWFLSVDGVRDFSARSRKIDSRKVCRWLDEVENQENIEPKVDTTDLVVLDENKTPIATSLRVAKAFKKKHKNVIQSIETLECSTDFNRLNFQPVKYKDKKGEARKGYEMTRDGFFFLAMGFTGSRAAKFKEEFIEAFNALELNQKEPTLNPEIISKAFYNTCRDVGLYPNTALKLSVEATERLTGINTKNSLPATEPLNQIDHKPLPQQLRRIRQDKHITQRSLSLSLFGDCDIYGKMERGIMPISELQLDKILTALESKLSDLKSSVTMDDLIILSNVFMYIPELRKYLEIVNTASQIDEDITKEMGRFAGAKMFDVCV